MAGSARWAVRLGALGLALAVGAPGAAAGAAPMVRVPDVLRFRVIANSDSPWDQAVKNAVRDAVLARIDPALARVHTTAAAEHIVRSRLPSIRTAVDAVLRTDGAPYGATVRLGPTLFPPKAYGTWLLPGGDYEALVIRLGRGAGHNWWCVLFPTLCFVDMGSSVAVPPPAPRRPVARPRPAPARVFWGLPDWLIGWLARL
jgi:stage II sporulation protein R